jgi:hypothetical protein
VSSEISTVRIWHENLASMAINDRTPLSELTAKSHVHGGLRLEIAGRLVSHMGYFGRDDVCFAQWLVELDQVTKAFEHPGGRHVFDEGEQGQPAFVFERDDSRGYFTLAASELSGAEGDAEWQRVEFSPLDFIAAYGDFRSSFVAALKLAAPGVAETWLSHITQ